MTIRRRIFVAYGVALLLVVAFSLFQISGIVATAIAIEEVAGEKLPIVGALRRMNDGANLMLANLDEAFLVRTLEAGNAAITSEEAEFEKSRTDFNRHLSSYMELAVEYSRDIDLATQIKTTADAYTASMLSLLEAIRAGAGDEQILALRTEMQQRQEAFDSAMNTVDVIEDKDLESSEGVLVNLLTFVVAATLLGATALILILLVGGIAVLRSVTRPIAQLLTATDQIAAGDYSQRVQTVAHDEIGQLAASFNAMAGAVQTRDQTVVELNNSLERRVQERTQQLEIANREALEANRLKDEFLATMSHELRTPLNAIIGFSGLLMMVGKLNPDQKGKVERIRSNGERLLSLINDILDISRIEAGRLTFSLSELPIREVVDRLAKQMSVLADQKGLMFNIHLDDSLPETIYTDEDVITKIITNLVGNAVKFTAQGEVSLAMRCEEDKLIIDVTDTGIGIPPHMNDVIFDKFRQVDGTSRREYGGSGLGLSIVRQLAEAMDGKVHLQSELGKGSTFTVTLPLAPDDLPTEVLEEVVYAG